MIAWTSDQKKVIETRDQDILVSAAAGSGKTAVLVERILSRILDAEHPVDIDRLLVLTFTNAAAGEMRERIRSRLEERAEMDPEQPGLRRQLMLVHHAPITTIHSFCLQVLRNHFYTIGLDPSFRVADEGEVRLLSRDAAREIIDEAYEEKQEAFIHFVESMVPGREDRELEEWILELYGFSMGHPYPEEYLESCRRKYQFSEGETPEWVEVLFRQILMRIRDQIRVLAYAEEIARSPEGPFPYLKNLTAEREYLEQLGACQTYQSLYEGLEHASEAFTRLPAIRDKSIDVVHKETVKELRSQVKKEIETIKTAYFSESPDILLGMMRDCRENVEVFLNLTEKFSARFAEKKAEKNILDFQDMEHMTLQILLEKGEDGKRRPSAAAQEYVQYYEEIMTDEYQDSNLVQELILSAVSGESRGIHNRFMVGDVKQSIYRFRLARPELFMEKYESFAREENTGQVRIDLHQNFRSRGMLLEGINRIFYQIMEKSLGKITYDAAAALYPGAEYPQREGKQLQPVELRLLSLDDAEENAKKTAEIFGKHTIPDKKELEAVMAGSRIRELVGSFPVWDKEKKEYRPACYRDIVILLRNGSDWAQSWQDTLVSMGIPCYTGTQSGYFHALEVRTMLSYLRILDNPYQDFPLTAVLRSPIGELTDEELALLRIGRKKESLWDSLQHYRAEGGQNPSASFAELTLQEKLQQFLEDYEALRAQITYTPIHELIWNVMDRTGYLLCASSMPGGALRRANLMMLVEKAAAYEATSYRGLFHFIRYIDQLKKYEIDYGEANIQGESADLVRIMTIHKSKGLEFPIVILGGLSKLFNESDSRKRIVLHADLGIGCDYTDLEHRISVPTLLKKMIQRQIHDENLGEELRILYVAMTRAREKLILTGAVSDYDRKINVYKEQANREPEILSYSTRAEARCYLDWIYPAFWRAQRAEEGADLQKAHYLLCRETCQDLWEKQQREKQQEGMTLWNLQHLDLQTVYDPQTEQYLQEIFSADSRETVPLHAKISVSELKKLSMDEEETWHWYGEGSFSCPDSQEEGDSKKPVQTGLRGAQRGTAYHTLMRNLVFSSGEGVKLQLEELIKCGKMTQDEGESICLSQICTFLDSDLSRRMYQAEQRGSLYREQPFVIGLPAREIRPEWNYEQRILIQGIIDAYFYEEDGSITLLDYKTDYIEDGEILKARYHTQLEIYARALEQITGRPVTSKWLYSFHLGIAILV